MSDVHEASEGYIVPMLASTHARKVQQASTSTSAASQALFTGLTTAPTGKLWVTFYAGTVDCYVAFKQSASGATVTTTTGWPITAGSKESWWINTNDVAYIEHITASGTGTLKWYVSSKQCDAPIGGF